MTEHVIAGCDCRVDGHHIGKQLFLLGSWEPSPVGYGFGVSIESQGYAWPPRGGVPQDCWKYRIMWSMPRMGWEGKDGRDMTLVIAWRAFTVLQHSCILYCCVLGGMCVHLNFQGQHVCLTYIAYHVYSVIDPSGTLILGVSLVLSCCLLRGMCMHFKFSRIACMHTIYCISCVFGD